MIRHVPVESSVVEWALAKVAINSERPVQNRNEVEKNHEPVSPLDHEDFPQRSNPHEEPVPEHSVEVGCVVRVIE